MLREEILAIEIVVGPPIPTPTAVRIYLAEPRVTSPEPQLEVLGGDVALPLVLGGEDCGAAVRGEGAWEVLRGRGGGGEEFLAGFAAGGAGFSGGLRSRVCGFGDTVVGGESG